MSAGEKEDSLLQELSDNPRRFPLRAGFFPVSAEWRSPLELQSLEHVLACVLKEKCENVLPVFQLMLWSVSV